MSAPASSRRRLPAEALVGAAILFVALAILVWWSLPQVMQGLSSADDAFFAEWAKAVGQGRGFGAPMTDATSRLFDPTMGGGPAMLLPVTGVLLATGPAELVPGAVTVVVFLLQLLVLAAVLSRRWGPGAASAYVALLVLGLLVATQGFFLFGKYLGEPWTLGFLLIGAALLVSGDRRSAIIAGGICLSLAYLTKQVGAFGAAGIAAVWIGHELWRGVDARRRWGDVAVFVGACAVLPVTWELVKLASLGLRGWIDLTREALVAGPQAGGLGAGDPVATALAILERNYVPPLALGLIGIASVVAILVLRRRSLGPDRAALAPMVVLAAMLWAATLGQLAYFLGSRSDWPRYLWLTVALALAASLAPVLGMPARLRTGILLVAGLVSLLIAVPRLPTDPLAPSPLREERAAVVAWLAADPALPYAAVKWSSIYDVVFPLRDEGRWVMEGDLRQLARADFAYIVNRAFTDDWVLASRMHQAAERHCLPVITGERLVVRRCGDAFWTEYLGAPGPDGTDGHGPAAVTTDDLLSSPDAWVPGSATALTSTSEVPQTKTGWSLVTAIDGLPAGTGSFTQRKLDLDGGDLAADGTLAAWVRASSLEQLDGLFVVLFSGGDWAAYAVKPDTAGTWQEVRLPLARPVSTSGNVDWNAVTAIYLRVDAADGGPYTGEVLWHDLRMVPGP